jgi:hypothetical protein
MTTSILHWMRLAGCACLFATWASAQAAPPTLTYLFPAGAQRGQTIEVTAGGSFDPWPVQVWVDGKGIAVQAAKDKGKLSVTVAPDAVPGIYWIRLYNEQGATSPRPFLVGTLPEVLEQEPNDDPKKPQVLPSSEVTVNGRLERNGDVDGFAVKLHKGQTLVASLEANRVLGSPMDAVLQVVSADGFVLEQNNDYHDLDPQIVFTAPADATYVIRTFAFPATPDSSIRFAGGETYIYRLTLTTGGFVDHVYPLAVTRSHPEPVAPFGWNIPEAATKLTVLPEPDADTGRVFHPLLANPAWVRLEPHPTTIEVEPNDWQHPQPITLPLTITGRIDVPGDVDVYQFQAKKGQKLFFQVEARRLGSPLDPVLRLADAAGKTLVEVDDTGPARSASRDAELTFTVPEDGKYHVEVRDLHAEGQPRAVYRLRALFAEPDYELTVAADHFIVTPGKPLEIPVRIDRRNSFDREVEITVDGLPEGVTAALVTSTPTGSAAKSVVVRVSAQTGPVSVPLRLLGKVKSGPERTRRASAAITGLNASTTRLWLTILKPKEAAEKK